MAVTTGNAVSTPESPKGKPKAKCQVPHLRGSTVVMQPFKAMHTDNVHLIYT